MNEPDWIPNPAWPVQLNGMPDPPAAPTPATDESDEEVAP